MLHLHKLLCYLAIKKKEEQNAQFSMRILLTFIITIGISGYFSCEKSGQNLHRTNQKKIVNTAGLIAFWNFESSKGLPFENKAPLGPSYPIYLKQIGNAQAFTTANWPYQDEYARIHYDQSGPLGSAIRFNRGYIYGLIPRDSFEYTPLNIQGYRPFTVVAWVKYVGQRHMAAGIWDEGGWHKYAGRRQFALFAGLFNQKGVIAHISKTGAASYPQSKMPGSQYARIRAIDGNAFANDVWICMAMTYSPEKQEVTAYLNGKATSLHLNDPVTQDVLNLNQEASANPLKFDGPIFSPELFLIKFHGYETAHEIIKEHSIAVNLPDHKIKYQVIPSSDLVPPMKIHFDIQRNSRTLLSEALHIDAIPGQWYQFNPMQKIMYGDTLITSLSKFDSNQWKIVGDTIKKCYEEGAPFTFGRALGLASGELEHGSELYIDGVAVFNRVLTSAEMLNLSLIDN